MTIMEKTHHPHDVLIKSGFSDKHVAYEFFEHYLPADVRERIASDLLSTLQSMLYFTFEYNIIKI